MNVKVCSKWFAAAAFAFGAQGVFANCDETAAAGETVTQITCAAAQAALQVYVGGASAPDNGIAASLLLPESLGGVFEDDSVRRFDGEVVDGTGNSDSTVTCGFVNATAAAEITSEGGLTAGDALCIHKTAHGSGRGNGPLAASNPEPFFDISNLGTADCPDSTEITANGVTYEVHSACGDANEDDMPPGSVDGNSATLATSAASSTTIVQHGGASDVEPALFFLDAALLDTGPVLALPWQIQATVPLYLALQATQFPTSSVCNPTNPMYDASGDGNATIADSIGVSVAPECVPSLTTGQVRSWFSQGLGFINELVDEDGVPFTTSTRISSVVPGPVTTQGNSLAVADPTQSGGTSSSEFNGGTITSIVAPTAGDFFGAPLWLCRRQDGSGTQASFENIFMRQRCEDGAVEIAAQNNPVSNSIGSGDGDDIDPTDPSQAALTVHGGTGSSDVVECLERVANAGLYGIGINSTERVYSDESVDRDNWRTVKIDGVLPTSRNVVKGNYPYFSEIVCNTLPGEDTTVIEAEIVRDLVCVITPTALSGLLPEFEHEWGQGGGLGIPGGSVGFLPDSLFTTDMTGTGLTEAELAATPINTYTKSLAGPTNNCSVPTKVASGAVGFFPSDVVPSPSEPDGSPFDTP